MRKITLRKLTMSLAFCLLTFSILQAQYSYSVFDDSSVYDEYEMNNSNSDFSGTTLSKNHYYAPDLFVKELKKVSRKKQAKKSPFWTLPSFDININPNRGDMSLDIQLNSPHLGILDVELSDKKGNLVKKVQLDCANENCLEMILKYQSEGKYKLKFYTGGQSRKLVKAFKVFKYDGWYYA